jgi:integrase/recombinase XerD
LLEAFLKDRVGINTSMTHIKHVRRAVLYGVEQKYIDRNPFEGFKAKWQPIDRGFLTQSELDQITTANLSHKRMIQVRDCFVFQCYTGISHSDLINIKIEGDIITGVRNKTGKPYVVPILPEADRILKQYEYKLPI